MTTTQHIILKFKDRLFKNLEEKNSWGKNEIKTLFNDTLLEVTYGMIQEGENSAKPGLQEKDGGEKDLALRLQEFLHHIADRTGEVLNEYHWREACQLEVELREKFKLPLKHLAKSPLTPDEATPVKPDEEIDPESVF